MATNIQFEKFLLVNLWTFRRIYGHDPLLSSQTDYTLQGRQAIIPKKEIWKIFLEENNDYDKFLFQSCLIVFFGKTTLRCLEFLKELKQKVCIHEIYEMNTVETHIEEPIFIRTFRLNFNILNPLIKNISEAETWEVLI